MPTCAYRGLLRRLYDSPGADGFTQITEALQQCTLPRNHDKATDEGESRVQEANASDEMYTRPGRLRLYVVRVGSGFEDYHNEVPVQQQTY